MPGLRFRDRLVVFVGIVVCVLIDAFKRLVTREKPDIGPVRPDSWTLPAAKWAEAAGPAPVHVSAAERAMHLARLQAVDWPRGIGWPDAKDSHEGVLKPGAVRPKSPRWTAPSLGIGQAVQAMADREEAISALLALGTTTAQLRSFASMVAAGASDEQITVFCKMVARAQVSDTLGYDEGPVNEAEYAARAATGWEQGQSDMLKRLLAERPLRSGDTAAMESELNTYLAADKAETLGEYGDRMRAKFSPDVVKRISEGMEPAAKYQRPRDGYAGQWIDKKPTNSELHERCAHPDWEYATTEGPRKQWDYANVPPKGKGWRTNEHRGRNAWERFEYTEEAYWRRLRPKSVDGES